MKKIIERSHSSLAYESERIPNDIPTLKIIIKDKDAEISKLRLLINTKNEDFTLERSKFHIEAEVVKKCYDQANDQIEVLKSELNKVIARSENLEGLSQEYADQIEVLQRENSFLKESLDKVKTILLYIV